MISADERRAELLEEVARLLDPYLDRPLPTPELLAAQRWGSALYPGLRHGRESETEPEVVLAVAEEGFAACGDFVAGSRLPGVIANAHATAKVVTAMLQKLER